VPRGLGHSRHRHFLFDIAYAGFWELFSLTLHDKAPSYDRIETELILYNLDILPSTQFGSYAAAAAD
jgi:hypothetical protein